MKYFLALLFLYVSLFANEKQKITIGAGPYIQTQPYKNVDDIVLPSPVIFYDNELFYIRWSRYGMYFLGNKTDSSSWAFSLTIQPRVYGYDSDDIVGMDDRKTSLEGGIAFSAKKDGSFVEFVVLTDIIHNANRWVVQSEIGHTLKYKKLSLYPSIVATYQSSNFTNYYYGVSSQEATRRSSISYTPSSGIQIGVQSYIEYPLTEKLSFLANIKADRISSKAYNSPLVDEKYIYSGLASLIYTFEY